MCGALTAAIPGVSLNRRWKSRREKRQHKREEKREREKGVLVSRGVHTCVGILSSHTHNIHVCVIIS